MRKRVICLLIVIILAGGTVGASAADGSWAEGNMPACCKKAKSTGKAPEVSMARLCCKLNCSEPNTGGSSSVTNFLRNQGTTSIITIVPSPTPFSPLAFRDLDAHLNHSRESNPKYIQHLALLI
ncbi:MAG TPA: hypothetical protein VFI24_07005 [Pyrinomonadaceae bacterium]|nr:hypothetical protein [Pyrinomonadaceae bacterium]